LRLIVAEVVLDWSDVPLYAGMALPKPEGTTWYGDAQVFVRTREGTPPWQGRSREHRRRRGGFLRRDGRS
jgi:hypothetical protein